MQKSKKPIELTETQQEFAALARTILGSKNVPITQIRAEYTRAFGPEVRIVVDGSGSYEARLARVSEATNAIAAFFVNNPEHKFADPYKQPLYSVRYATQRSPIALAP